VSGINKSPNENHNDWIWTGEYLKIRGRERLADNSQKMQHTSQRQFIINLPGYFVHPLGPSLVALPSLTTEATYGDSELAAPLGRMTWKLSSAQLQKIIDYAWAALSPETSDIVMNVAQLPVVESAHLPYKNMDGMHLSSVLRYFVTYSNITRSKFCIYGDRRTRTSLSRKT
jgi:hypothetical protein